MAHEQLKKQYAEDCKNHEKPWELWEFRKPFPFHSVWTSMAHEPAWIHNYEYRRKDSIEPVSFQSEYFSGLNWRNAKPLEGKVVEFSDDPDRGWKKGVLSGFLDKPYHFQKDTGFYFEYIRTCPETHAHPTITLTVNGRQWILPKPEVEAPSKNTVYWLWSGRNKICRATWDGDFCEKGWLTAGRIHLTESRAQAWANWWQNTVIVAIKASNNLS